MYDVGDSVVLTTTLADPDTDLPIDATSIQLTVTPPTGPAVVLAGSDIEHDLPGVYRASFTAAAAGAHRYAWAGTGPLFADTGAFYVWPPLTVLSLDDARQHLNITGTEQDDELRRTIIATTDAIENLTGPLTPTVFTKRLFAQHHRRGAVIVLPDRPVLSVDELVSAAGRTFAVNSWTATCTVSGVLTFPGGPGEYDVTWTAGRTSVPGDLYQALLELLRHLMQPQRGGASRANQASQIPGAAYAFPNRVTELLRPHLQYVGV